MSDSYPRRLHDTLETETKGETQCVRCMMTSGSLHSSHPQIDGGRCSKLSLEFSDTTEHSVQLHDIRLVRRALE